MQQVPGSLSGFRGVRAELLIALKKAPQPLTAKELADRFGLTPNALRRHLDSLESEELVRHRREVRGVGAPVHAFVLTDAGEALFPQGYADVLSAVLEAVRESDGPAGVRRVLARQWAGLVEGAETRLAELPLRERAQLVAELRSSQGYMAEATALGEDGAVIREHHCAIREVAERFPEVCEAEQDLMERLLGVPVERTGHMLAGCSHCEYTARVPASAGDRGPRPEAPRACGCAAVAVSGAAPASGDSAPSAARTTIDHPPCTCASRRDALQEQA
jgi:DeoR family suf operon transcriptional repressor